jgi:hypothetical protein
MRVPLRFHPAFGILLDFILKTGACHETANHLRTYRRFATLAGNGAMAADTYAKTGAAAPAHTAVHVAPRQRYPVARYAFIRPPVDVAQIISSLLASPFVAPYVAQYAGKIRTADLRYLVAAGQLRSAIARRASGGAVPSGDERHQCHDGIDGGGRGANRRR